MFLFGCIIVDIFTQIPEESYRREQLHVRGGKNSSYGFHISAFFSPQVLSVLVLFIL